MRDYEIVYIFKSSFMPEEIEQKLEKYHGVLTGDGGEITAVEQWGKRQLAYPIRKESNGYYVIAQFTAQPAALPEFERRLKLDEDLLRHLIVISEGELPRPAASLEHAEARTEAPTPSDKAAKDVADDAAKDVADDAAKDVADDAAKDIIDDAAENVADDADEDVADDADEEAGTEAASENEGQESVQDASESAPKEAATESGSAGDAEDMAEEEAAAEPIAEEDGEVAPADDDAEVEPAGDEEKGS